MSQALKERGRIESEGHVGYQTEQWGCRSCNEFDL